MNPQAVAIHNHPVAILTCFLIGHLIHIWVEANGLVLANTNAATSDWRVIQQNGAKLTFRFFLNLMLFIGLWHNPATFVAFIELTGITLSPGVASLMTIPMTLFPAGMIGLMGDWALGKLPWFKNVVPPIEFHSVTKTVEKTVETKTDIVSTPLAPGAEGGK